ncbi:MAG: leucine-rich repeat domain-containing protein [Promethearchaeota archaeon]
MSVKYKDKLYKITTGKKSKLVVLNLRNLGISDLTEVEGLSEAIELQKLILSNNNITEIKGLENLKNLEELYLNNNHIIEIKGIENFKKLKYLNLFKNPVFKEAKKKYKVGYYNEFSHPQKLVKYCREKKEKNKDKFEKEIILYIKKLFKVYEEISYKKIIERTGISAYDLEIFLEDIIARGELKARMMENSLKLKQEQSKIKTEIPKEITVEEDKFEKETDAICFACGEKIDPLQEICPFCGIILINKRPPSDFGFYLHEALLPIKEKKDLDIVLKYFLRIFTILSADIRQNLLNLKLPDDEKQKIVQAIAFLNREQQKKYLEELIGLYSPPKGIN